jgi:UDP-glucose 4-epimerase
MKEYKSKNILVTGGASFIGSHLVDKLVASGSIVSVIDDLSSGIIGNLEKSMSSIKFIEADLRDTSTSKYFKDQDFVFHLANIHGGRGFIETHPGEICQNFLIDGNVFRSCHEHGVKKVVYTSSACAYPTNLQSSNLEDQERYLSEEMANPFKKGAALADGEYGWAKFMGEMALKAYNKQYGMKGVSCRLFTVYGPRENESHAVIALIAKALVRQDPYEIWGTGQQDRNFTYVSDIVDGIMLSGLKIDDCRSINIGTSEITKIVDAAKIIMEILKFSPNKINFDTSKPEGVHARAASIEMQKKWLNWEPVISFDEGIKSTIEWYAQYCDVEELKKTLQQKLFERK